MCLLKASYTQLKNPLSLIGEIIVSHLKMKPSPQQSNINNNDDYDDGDKITESYVGIPLNAPIFFKKMVVSGHVSAHLYYSTRYMSSPVKPGTG